MKGAYRNSSPVGRNWRCLHSARGFRKHSAKHNLAFIIWAASETGNYKFRVILSWKVTDGFKRCKQ